MPHDFHVHTIIRNSRSGVVRESIAMLCRCKGLCFPGIGGNDVTFTIDDSISKFARLVERVDGVESQIGSYYSQKVETNLIKSMKTVVNFNRMICLMECNFRI